MNAIDIILGIVLFINIILSTLIFIYRRMSEGSAYFAVAAYSTAFWTLSMILFRNISNTSFLIIPAKSLYIAGILIATNFLYFSYLFLEKRLKNRKLLFGLISIPPIVAVTLITFTGTIIRDTSVSNNLGVVNFGFLYIPYFILILVYFTWAYSNLFKRIREYPIKSSEKMQLLFVIIGTLTTVIFGFIYDLIIPFYGNFTFYWLGPVITVTFVAATSYAIFKHHLFDIRVITTEFLTFVLWIFLLTQTLLANTLQDRLINGTLLVLTVFLGVLLIRSVLKEVEAREEIEKLAHELDRVNRAQADFLSMASHQLKTPLSIVKGYISMALEGSFGAITKTLQPQLEKVYASNERLIRLVEDLLNLSRIEDGRMKYDWSEENMADIVTSVVNELRERAEKKGLTLLWQPPPETWQTRMDATKIRNVILNLIDNAIKYTQDGSITISLEKERSSLLLSVRDTGVGMAQGMKDSLFKKFTRAEKEEGQYAVGGFGLGLYVAKLITRDHNGEIWGESAGEGKGSTFYLKLPLAPQSK